VTHPQFEPLALYRNTRTGRVSHNLRDVLDKRVTVSLGYRCEPVRKEGGVRTLFQCVEFVPRMQALPAEAWAMMDMPVGGAGRTYPAGVADAIVDAIEAAWAPGKFHRVYHSSGWDSRILSAAIRRLYERNGADWLGDVLFVCISNECDLAAHILELEGWGPEHFLGIPNVGPLVARMTDLTRAGRWLNGVTLQAVDYNWPLTEYLQEIGAAPSDDAAIQVFSGRNETLMGATLPTNRLSWAWGEAYASYLAISRYKVPDVVFPFSAYGVVRAALASDDRFDWSTPAREDKCGFRRGIGEYLCPALTGVPRGTLEMPELPAERVAEMAVEYSRTWYGMMIWPKARNDATGKVLGKHAWWGAWSAAALCEALLQEGYELNVS
jgi:hypothetical protein